VLLVGAPFCRHLQPLPICSNLKSPQAEMLKQLTGFGMEVVLGCRICQFAQEVGEKRSKLAVGPKCIRLQIPIAQ